MIFKENSEKNKSNKQTTNKQKKQQTKQTNKQNRIIKKNLFFFANLDLFFPGRLVYDCRNQCVFSSCRCVSLPGGFGSLFIFCFFLFCFGKDWGTH